VTDTVTTDSREENGRRLDLLLACVHFHSREVRFLGNLSDISRSDRGRHPGPRVNILLVDLSCLSVSSRKVEIHLNYAGEVRPIIPSRSPVPPLCRVSFEMKSCSAASMRSYETRFAPLSILWRLRDEQVGIRPEPTRDKGRNE
jgi:hypothetical protein